MNARKQNNPRRKQRRRGGRRPPPGPKGPMMTALGESTYEAVFDHGKNGYGIWFDGMVRDDPMYKQNWKGTGFKPLFVKIEADQIIISKELESDEEDEEEEEVEEGNDATVPDEDESAEADEEEAVAAGAEAD